MRRKDKDKTSNRNQNKEAVAAADFMAARARDRDRRASPTCALMISPRLGRANDIILQTLLWCISLASTVIKLHVTACGLR